MFGFLLFGKNSSELIKNLTFNICDNFNVLVNGILF